MTKMPETIVVTEEEYMEDGFKDPSAYFFKSATGSRVYVKTRDRKKAQEVCDDWTGRKGLYKVISANPYKSSGSKVTVRGVETR